MSCQLELQKQLEAVSTLQNKLQEQEKQLKQVYCQSEQLAVQLGGLNSMETKCQELYEEIRRERAKWENATHDNQQQKAQLQLHS